MERKIKMKETKASVRKTRIIPAFIPIQMQMQIDSIMNFTVVSQ